ncbi:hypothetical protein [Phenylobacterium sp. NIBR 498073]|uniref:hypothetical protein n=1 Tax=Phenylobacterium sp. NIBR 498073 TaxID=3015177 RepID=UPI0022B2B20E|nr:hypothetical protein [Phenylobacterium sp. NIBR 498073]WGU39021.1 hypothetical protein O4N75_15375 [Phenylobacterium sp. NIBR 498073]
MSKYETLISEMRYQNRLKITCACGHKADFRQSDAIKVFGPDATPFDIRRRMRCSRCHEIGKVEVTI